MSLRVENLSFSYHHKKVLNNVSFNIETSGITALLGPNGSGKTSLLRCINNILKPQKGQVLLNGRPSSLMTNRERASLLSYTTQHTMPANISVFDAVLLGRVPYIISRALDQDIKETAEVINKVGLKSIKLRKLSELSGGELQKTAIARAIVQDAPIMLLDEPTASLDLKNQIDILLLLKKNAIEKQRRVLISIHDLNTALRYADNFIFLKEGSIVSVCERKKISRDIIEEVYGIPVEIYRQAGLPFVIPLQMLKEE